eukprot:CCRYP_011089-RB/>CCRYP_011089-RB protein AED:0.22 eAED:0.22 QI:220/1/1/1/1/1/2/568/197
MKSSFIFFLASIGASSAFAPISSFPRHTSVRPSSTTELDAHKLVLVRHGESTWNDLNIFTGWADADLNEKGKGEALAGGKLLKDAEFTFDVAYTSVLKRAIKTLWIILEELDLMYIPIVSSLFYQNASSGSCSWCLFSWGSDRMLPHFHLSIYDRVIVLSFFPLSIVPLICCVYCWNCEGKHLASKRTSLRWTSRTQ